MKTIITLIFLSLGLASMAQDLLPINEARNKKTKGSIMVLGGWATANIIAGSIAAGSVKDENYYFHTMNVGWNAVNLGISALGYFQLRKENFSEYNLAKTVKSQNSLQTAYLINSALDLAYITGGFYLKERSKNDTENADQLNGFGRSIILQGSFLLGLDIVSYIIHLQEDKAISKILNNIQLTPNTARIIIPIN